MSADSLISASNTDSGSLVNRLKTGEAAAWKRFSAIYGPLVFDWARQAGLQDSDAADVTQIVFQVVAERIGDFRHDGPADTFRGWLRTIARHKILDEFRRRAVQPGLAESGDLADLAESLSTPSHDDLSHELTALAHRALALLRSDFQPATWQAFEQLVIEGRSAADVAQNLGLSLGSVYTAKCRVLARLRQELGDVLTDFDSRMS